MVSSKTQEDATEITECANLVERGVPNVLVEVIFSFFYYCATKRV